MQVRILGPMEATSDGDLVPLGGQKQRIVLAALAVRLGQVVTTDELVEAGWGDDLPANPTNTLQYQIAQLRKLVEPDGSTPRYLITAKPGYRLAAETVTTDAQQFESLVAAARSAFDRGELGSAQGSLQTALDLWRGPALADVRDFGFARSEAERLEAERLEAIELDVDIGLAAGRHAEVNARLGQLTDEYPLREGLWARRVLALHRSGRRSEALRAFQEAREALAEVGLDPGSELRELEQRILEDDDSLILEAPRPSRSVSNLPAPPNRLIGRDRDVEAVCELLQSSRLVTLLGPGGAGKTRLSIAVAEALRDRFPGGVWFVPLDGLDDDSLLASEVGRASGMREAVDRTVVETLAQHLGQERSLVVLDNCDHLVQPVAAFVLDLMARCASLSILATSQVTLETAGETVFAVTPLALPGETQSIYDPITDSAAMELFIERARDAGTKVESWDDGALAAAANIVSALDGLPLAVELAAARTRSMSLEEIAEGLSDRFTTLSRGLRTAPKRQQSLLGAVEWSMNLLETRQRQLVEELSVFAGGFDSDDAAAVSGLAMGTIHNDLADLVNRSLLRRDRDVAGSARFSMLESLRQYGVSVLGPERLTAVRDAHLGRFADFARAANNGLRGADQISWLHRIDSAYDNIRAALEWSLQGESLDAGIGLVADIGRYWDWRGLLKEGSLWTERMSAAVERPVPGLVAMRAWSVFIAWEYGDLEQARRASDLAIAEARQLNDPYDIAVAVSTRMLIGRSDGNLDIAHRAAMDLVQAADAADDPWMVAWAESALATVCLAAGELNVAQDHADRSVELFDSLGDRRALCWGRIAQAQIELGYGRVEAAEEIAARALKSAVETEDDRNVLWALEVLTEAALQRSEFQRAARLWGAGQPLRDSRGLAGSVSKLSEPKGMADALSQQLGADFDAFARPGRRDPSGVISAELAKLASR